ncbi:MAG TPA: TonB-dependent receptor plug domain-containing protein, partial [Opitutaceae bacterium]|nr:TonB-dependent receptor plug domain-containing protein [Opitutaceae bacterium]
MPSSPQEQTPIQLSPFEVNAGDEQGYASSQALSGTRLRTDVRDLAASISIVNLNFMDDLDVHNLDYLLDYTLGTEVSGLGGNFSGAANEGNFMEFDSTLATPNPTTRVRGLESADITRDFFLSTVPVDDYNLDRIEIDRGANAMLFGLGSPAGIINSTLITAQTNATKTKVTDQYGSYGTNRNVLDHNQVLIPDMLAVRIALDDDNEYYRIKPSYDSSQRMYLTSTFTPLKGTIVRASMEIGADNSNRPQNRPPWDDYTYWWKIGKPTYDPTTGLMTINTPSTLAGLTAAPAGTTGLPSTIYPGSGYNVIFPGISGSGGGLYKDNWAFIYSNPNSSVPNIPGYPGILGMQVYNAGEHLGNGGWQVGGTPGNGPQPDGMVSLANTSSLLNYLNVGGNPANANHWVYQQLTNPNIFNFYDYQLDGDNAYQYARWNTYNVTIEQHFLNDHAGVELAYDRQDVYSADYDPMGWNGYAVQVDMNTKILNGAANPNLGRPLIYSDDYATAANNLDSRTAERATAYYDLDLRRSPVLPSWASYILGRHVFNFTATQQWDYDEGHDGGGIMNSPLYSLETGHSTPGDINNVGSGGSRQIGVLSYTGNSMINSATPGNVPAILVGQTPNYTDANILYAAAPTPGQTTLSPWGVFNTAIEPASNKNIVYNDQYPSKSLYRVNSDAFVMQDFLLDDTIATTFGWRNDQYKEWNAGSPNLNPNTGQLIEDPADWALQYQADGGRPSFNYGLVGHLPDFVKRHLPLGMDLSIYYNQGDNYQPTVQRYTVFGSPIAPETGATKEYGIGLSLFDGKFELRATHYQSAAALNTSGSLEAPIYLLADDVDDILTS